jgi:hypothetical protein
MLVETLGPDYVILETVKIFQMRISVYLHKRVAEKVDMASVVKGSENCGKMGR